MHENSEVHKAIHKMKGSHVALKRILMHNEKEGMPITALREIKILKALQHPCIIDIFDMFVVRSEFLFCHGLRLTIRFTSPLAFPSRQRKGGTFERVHGVSVHGP